MPTLSPTAKFSATDVDGSPLIGGKLYTYAAGTTTPLSSYVSSSGAANTNPVILDSRGEADVWLSQDAPYKLVLKDSNDVQIWSVDYVNGDTTLASSGGSAGVGWIQSGTGASATTVQAKLRRTVEAEDFGAVGDGTTNNTTAIQAAIDAMFASGGGYVQLQIGKTYRIDGTLQIKSGVVLGHSAGMWDTFSTFTANNEPATARLLKHGGGDAVAFYHGGTLATQFAGGGLIGITIDGTNQTSGGGVLCTQPTAAFTFGGFVKNCIFEKCYAYGIYLPLGTYSMQDFKIVECMFEGTRSVAAGEGSGIINYATDTHVRNAQFFRNARHGVENYGGSLRLNDVDSFYNTQCGLYDAGQATKAIYTQFDANGTYGIDFEVSAVYTAGARQHRFSNCLVWKNNTSAAANGRNVKFGQTGGGAGLTNISFGDSIFGASAGETVEYHLAVSAPITDGQNRFTNCQMYDYSTTSLKSMNDDLWKMSFFAACGTGTEQIWTKPTTLADGTTQPSVQLTSFLQTANTAPTTIVNLLVGKPGQEVKVLIPDAFTTVDFSFSNLKGNGGVDWAAPAGSSMTCTTPDGTTWYCIVSGG